MSTGHDYGKVGKISMMISMLLQYGLAHVYWTRLRQCREDFYDDFHAVAVRVGSGLGRRLRVRVGVREWGLIYTYACMQGTAVKLEEV